MVVIIAVALGGGLLLIALLCCCCGKRGVRVRAKLKRCLCCTEETSDSGSEKDGPDVYGSAKNLKLIPRDTECAVCC